MVAIFTSWKMLTIQQFDRKKLRKSISSQLFLGSALFPLILVTVIGWFAAALLIIVPVTWYLFFSLLMGEKLFQPQI
jgi:fatty acid desaturase